MTRGRSRRLDLAAVLAGRLQPTASELLDLIGDVNPTARDLPARERDRRYDEKARLISLLVRRHSGSLEVARHGGDGVVSVRLGALGASCHAVLTSLDDDARAWIVRRLDEHAEEAPARVAPAPGTARGRPPTSEGPADLADLGDAVLVRAGADAIDAYDYDRARVALERALERSAGGTEAARWYLTLLVDHLAADAEALDVRPRLSREALANAEVRALLALAGVRAARPETARALLVEARGGPALQRLHPRAADALALLAAAALTEGDTDEAGRLLQRATECDPANPGITGVAKELARVLADGRRAHEAAAAARREIERRRNADEGRRLVIDAEEAAGRGDLSEASAVLHRAVLLLGDAGGDAKRRLAEIQSAQARRAREDRFAAALATLDGPDLAAGLASYCALEDDERRRVRERRSRRELAWVEVMLSRQRDAEDAIPAILDLVEASRVAPDDPAAALALLEPRARILAGVAEAEALAADCRVRVAATRRKAATERLQAAARALEAENPAVALELATGVPADALGSGERTELAWIADVARARIARREAEASYDRLRRSGDLLGARQVAESLVKGSDETTRERWSAAVIEAQRGIQASLGVWQASSPTEGTEAHPDGSVSLEGLWHRRLLDGEPDTWLDPEGRWIAFAEGHARWLFVVVVDVERARVARRMVVKTPHRLGLIEAEVIGGEHPSASTLVVAGEDADVLEIAVETGLVVAASPAVGARPHVDVVDQLRLAPGGRHLWMEVRERQPATVGCLRIVDIGRRRVARELRDTYLFRPVPGPERPLMACARDNTLVLHLPSGAPLDGGKFTFRHRVSGVCPHPSGRGLVVFLARDEDDPVLGFLTIDAAGKVSAPVWTALSEEAAWIAATALDDGLLFLQGTVDDGSIELRALAPHGDTLETRYSVTLPDLVRFLRDPSARRVFAAHCVGERGEIHRLGAAAPVWQWAAPARVDAARVSLWWLGCQRDEASSEEARRVESLRGRSEAALLGEVRTLSDERLRETGEMLDLHASLVSVRMRDAAAVLVERLRAHDPTGAHVALLVAGAAADRGDWADVKRRLGDVDLSAILPTHRRHAHHLLGLALLWADDPAALGVIERGLEQPGRCELEPLVELATPLPAEYASAGATGDVTPVLELRLAVRAADRALAAGDPQAAQRAIDIPRVWDAEEVQSMARLAEAHLRLAPTESAGQFRKASALARFVETNRPPPARNELPMLGATWSAERLAAIEHAAIAWLDELGASQHAEYVKDAKNANDAKDDTEQAPA